MFPDTAVQGKPSVAQSFPHHLPIPASMCLLVLCLPRKHPLPVHILSILSPICSTNSSRGPQCDLTTSCYGLLKQTAAGTCYFFVSFTALAGQVARQESAVDHFRPWQVCRLATPVGRCGRHLLATFSPLQPPCQFIGCKAHTPQWAKKCFPLWNFAPFLCLLICREHGQEGREPPDLFTCSLPLQRNWGHFLI